MPNAIIETKGTSISPITPTTVGGGPVISWEIHPSLPSGLNFDSSTGEISGTPSVLSTLTTYTMYANNTGGSASTTIDITVNDVPPSSISYSTTSFTETRDTAMTSVTPTVTGGGPIITWEVHPSLPTGLTIDSSTEKSAAPSIISVFTTYTVYANNTGGSASTTIDITVNDIIPSSITYSQTSFTETKGTAMTSVTPTSSGGPVVTWEIHPSLPSGLTIDSSTGEISGTPTVLSTFTTYTRMQTILVVANTNIDITVIDVPPSSIGYSNSPFSLTKDSAFLRIPSSGGGPVVTWSVSPTLQMVWQSIQILVR